jgi:hypothetical protein
VALYRFSALSDGQSIAFNPGVVVLNFDQSVIGADIRANFCLYYDADGNGAGATQIVSTFQGNPALTATDITII